MIIAVNTRLLLKNKLTGLGHFTHETLKVLVSMYPQHTFLFLFDRPWDNEFIFADNIIPIRYFPKQGQLLYIIGGLSIQCQEYLKNIKRIFLFLWIIFIHYRWISPGY